MAVCFRCITAYMSYQLGVGFRGLRAYLTYFLYTIIERDYLHPIPVASTQCFCFLCVASLGLNVNTRYDAVDGLAQRDIQSPSQPEALYNCLRTTFGYHFRERDKCTEYISMKEHSFYFFAFQGTHNFFAHAKIHVLCLWYTLRQRIARWLFRSCIRSG